VTHGFLIQLRLPRRRPYRSDQTAASAPGFLGADEVERISADCVALSREQCDLLSPRRAVGTPTLTRRRTARSHLLCGCYPIEPRAMTRHVCAAAYPPAANGFIEPCLPTAARVPPSGLGSVIDCLVAAALQIGYSCSQTTFCLPRVPPWARPKAFCNYAYRRRANGGGCVGTRRLS
jgi:hypothetical protein